MKIIIWFLSIFLTFQLKSQKLPIIVNDITVYSQYANTIKSMCVEIGDRVDNQIKSEIVSFS